MHPCPTAKRRPTNQRKKTIQANGLGSVWSLAWLGENEHSADHAFVANGTNDTAYCPFGLYVEKQDANDTAYCPFGMNVGKQETNDTAYCPFGLYVEKQDTNDTLLSCSIDRKIYL